MNVVCEITDVSLDSSISTVVYCCDTGIFNVVIILSAGNIHDKIFSVMFGLEGYICGECICFVDVIADSRTSIGRGKCVAFSRYNKVL